MYHEMVYPLFFLKANVTTTSQQRKMHLIFLQ